MLKVTCDACHKEIDREVGDWFGVDYQAAPVEVEPDDDGTVYLAELVQLGVDHEYHFDTADCAVSWFMERIYDMKPSREAT